MSLKNRTVSGVFWSFLDVFSKQFVVFIIGIILARLLLPEQFGLIGMISVFLNISHVFVTSGLPTALVREKNVTDLDYNTVFLFNLFVSVLFYLALFISSPSISSFYNEPELENLVKIVGLTIVINAIGSVQKAQLTKEINFKAQAQVNFISSLLSGVVAIYLAFAGFGVWSLVWRSIISSILFVALLFYFNRWIPKFQFSVISFKRLFSFSSKLLLAELISKVQTNSLPLLIGKLFSAQTLGFFVKADQFQKLFTENLYSIINRVTFPVLSTIQDEKQRINLVYRKMLKTSAIIIFPLIAILIGVAEPLVVLLIGEKWLPSVSYLQLLAGAGLLYPLHSLNLNNLKVFGKSGMVFKLAILKFLLLIPTLALGYYFNIEIMLIGLIVSSVIAYFINSYYSGKNINYSTKQQILDILPYLFISLMVGIIAFLVQYFANVHMFFRLFFALVASIVVLIVLLELLKDKVYIELKELIFKLISQKRT